MKNIIIVTGGAGFIGSNLIKLLLEKTRYKVISLDNYSSGKVKNHISNKKGAILDLIQKILKRKLVNTKKKLIQYFILENLQEFIKSLENLMNVFHQNSIGSKAVFKFCLENKK